MDDLEKGHERQLEERSCEIFENCIAILKHKNKISSMDILKGKIPFFTRSTIPAHQHHLHYLDLFLLISYIVATLVI